MNWFRTVALLLAVAMISASCSGDEPAQLVASTTTSAPDALALADPDEADERDTLRVSVPRITFVAPHVVDETDPIQIMVTDLLTDGLTELDPATGRARPALADDWSVSSDRLTWTFSLGTHTFSNGDPVRAVDVATSFNRLAARGVESLSGPNLAVVEGYSAVAAGEAATMSGVVPVDDTTLMITLVQPYEPLLELLAGVSFGIFPVDIDTRGTLPLSSSVRFRPSAMWEDGFRMAASDTGQHLQAIEVWADSNGDLLEAGEIDMALGLDPEDEFNGEFVSLSIPRSAGAYYAFNTQAAPFDDLLIRQAILQTIDPATVVAEHFNAAEPMAGLIPTAVGGGVDNACADRCELNGRAAARKIRRSDVDDVSFTVDFFVDGSDDRTEQRLAEDIVLALRDVELSAVARGHAVEDYGNELASGSLAMFRFGSVSTALVADAFLIPFVSDGPDNVTGVSLPEFDELILDARSTVDADARDALYAEAEALLFEQAVIAPLVQFQHHVVHADVLSSVSLEADGSLDLDALEFAG